MYPLHTCMKHTDILPFAHPRLLESFREPPHHAPQSRASVAAYSREIKNWLWTLFSDGWAYADSLPPTAKKDDYTSYTIFRGARTVYVPKGVLGNASVRDAIRKLHTANPVPTVLMGSPRIALVAMLSGALRKNEFNESLLSDDKQALFLWKFSQHPAAQPNYVQHALTHSVPFGVGHRAFKLPTEVIELINTVQRRPIIQSTEDVYGITNGTDGLLSMILVVNTETNRVAQLADLGTDNTDVQNGVGYSTAGTKYGTMSAVICPMLDLKITAPDILYAIITDEITQPSDVAITGRISIIPAHTPYYVHEMVDFCNATSIKLPKELGLSPGTLSGQIAHYIKQHPGCTLQEIQDNRTIRVRQDTLADLVNAMITCGFVSITASHMLTLTSKGIATLSESN